MAYSQAYDNLAWRIAREVFGDSSLAFVFYRMIKQESGFDSDVVEGRRASSAGAQGIAQFMPATAQEQGVDPLNPEQALRGAAAYLRKLIAYFGDQVAKGVAAYNAGAGRVEQAVAVGGSNWVGYLPTETQTYLANTQSEGVTAMPDGATSGTGWRCDQCGSFNPRDYPYCQACGAKKPPSAPAGPSGATAPAAGPAGTSNVPITVTPENIESLIQQLEAWVFSHPEDAQARADLNYLWDRYESYRKQGRLPSGAEAGLTPLEREQTEVDIEYTRALARDVIARLGGTRYEDQRQRFLDKIDQQHWTAEQALAEFRAWMEGAREAGKRAETVYGEQMKRKAWTTPGEYYPGTEPGGINEQMYERYGLGESYKPSPGVPVSQLPNLDEMYGQWHGRMGISQQAPPTQGGWSGQGAPGAGPMGGQGTGVEAARAFLEQLMQQYAPQFEAGRSV